MKVRCLDNEGGYLSLTVGKEYEVLHQEDDKYFIVNDKGFFGHYEKFRFTEKEKEGGR